MGRVVPSTKNSFFRSSSSGRLCARCTTRSSTHSMGTRRPRLRAPPAGRSRAPGRRGRVTVLSWFCRCVAQRPWTPRPRTRLTRKTSVSQLQDAHEPAETCDARYPGREDVCFEFDCAGALRELLQSEIALLRVQLGLTESAQGFGDTVSCPFCPWLQLKNGKGSAHALVRHNGPERRFVCTGTEQVRAVMALRQCDLFRG